MNQRGFAETSLFERSEVVFLRDDTFIEITYYPEDFPRYTPMVNVGKVDASGTRRLVGLWSVIPDNDEDRNYSRLVFSSKEEFRSLLEKLSNGAIARFALPLCDDPERLERVLSEQEESRKLEYEDSLLELRKEEASEAFRSGNYREVIRALDRVPRDKLSSLELKRFKYARDHLVDT